MNNILEEVNIKYFKYLGEGKFLMDPKPISNFEGDRIAEYIENKFSVLNTDKEDDDLTLDSARDILEDDIEEEIQERVNEVNERIKGLLSFTDLEDIFDDENFKRMCIAGEHENVIKFMSKKLKNYLVD